MNTHLKGFGLENFRVFKDHTWFDFAPITILTGPNNSGKSSLNKALLLMKDNYERGYFPLTWKTFLNETLKFDNPVHGLGGAKTSINEQSGSDTFRFSLAVSHEIFENPVFLSYSFINKTATHFGSFVELFDKNRKLIFRLTRKSMYLDLPLILTNFPDNFLTAKVDNYGADKKFDDWCKSKRTVNNAFFDFEPYLRYFRELVEYCDIEKWQNEIRFEEYYKDHPISVIEDDEIIEEQPKYVPYSEFIKILFSSLTGVISYFFEANGTNLLVAYDDDIIEKYLYPDDTERYNEPLEYSAYYTKALFGILELFVYNYSENYLYSTGLKEKFPDLSLIQYLPSIKGKLERSFRVNDEHTLNTLIREVNEKKMTKRNVAFLNKWVHEFQLDKIKIESNEGLGINYIKYKDKTLLDLGFGISQITAILLKITLCSESILILEEPEANLHPNFQSKLADMLVDAAKTFDIQFIVETHSEYLIRKLQYLTAKKEIKTEDTLIYYFHHPEYVPTGAQQVKKIEIQTDGSLSSDFGTGFFDEADNLAISLFNLKNRKN